MAKHTETIRRLLANKLFEYACTLKGLTSINKLNVKMFHNFKQILQKIRHINLWN